MLMSRMGKPAKAVKSLVVVEKAVEMRNAF